MTEGAGGGAGGQAGAGAGSPADPVPTGGHDRRDLGSGALVVAVVLTLLALIQPVATTTVRIRSVTSTSSSGWFGTLTSTGSTPAFGWAVVAGVGALAAATLLRWRRNASPVLAVAAGAWLLATGALVLAHTASRAQRVRDVLDEVVPAQVSLHPSAAPWLLVVAGALGVAAAFAPARQARSIPPRAEPGVVSWTPFEPRTRS